MQGNLPDDLMSVADAGLLGHGSANTLRNRIRDGRLTAYKVNGVTRVSASEVAMLDEPSADETHGELLAYAVKTVAMLHGRIDGRLSDAETDMLVTILRSGSVQ